MIPNPQAAQQATLGLALLAQDETDYSSKPVVLLAKKIQNREPLNKLEISKIREFHNTPHEATPGWVMANQLYGGQPMLDQIAALPVEKPKPKAAIYAALTKDVETLLKKTDAWACNRIELAELGDIVALSEMDLMQAEQVCETIAAATPPVTVEAKWETQTITAAGYETQIIFTHPELHMFKHQLDATLNRFEVPYNNQTPWAAAVTRQISPIDPGETLFAPFKTVIESIILDWGGEKQTWELQGRKHIEPVTAAAPPTKIVEKIGNKTLKDLQKLDERWLTSLEAVIEMAINQAMEKVGRTLKKQNPETYMTLTASPMEPTAIAIAADAKALETINVNQLITAPIDDALKQAENLTKSHIEAVQNLIGSNTGLIISLKNKYSKELGRAEQLLKNRLKAWVKWRLCTPGGEAKLDDFNKIIDAPPELVRDYAQTVGGDETVKDDEGLYRPTSTVNLIPALGAGLIGLTILDRAFEAYKGKPSTQYVINEQTALLPAQKEALIGLTPSTEVKIGESYTWTPNYYGKIKTEHHPDHKPRFGEVVENVSEVTGRRPGDHPFCKCGWKPDLSVIVNQ